LAIARAAGGAPDLLDRSVAVKLRDAQLRGALGALRAEDRRYLLRGYLRGYGLPEDMDVAEADAAVRLFIDAAVEPGDGRPGVERLFQAVERYLFKGGEEATAAEWRAWLALARGAGRVLDVTDPRVAAGLLSAKRRGRLHGLPDPDARYLLAFYLLAYETLLEGEAPAGGEGALPLVIELASVARLLGARSAAAAVQRFLGRQGPHPRALDRVSDEQAFDAPIRGVGSPNGIGLTLYHRDARMRPVQIACAGTTGDPTLNTRIFSSLFAAGLSCCDDTPVLSTAGALLRLGEAPAAGEDRAAELLQVAVEVTGAAEPHPGVPTVAMDADAAFELIGAFFQELQGSTGLAAVMRWSVDDAEALEARVRAALLDGGGGVRRIRSAPGHSEGAGVVHVLPLLHRAAPGVVQPVRIEVPVGAVGSGRFLRLVRAARHAYLSELITLGRRRQAVALDAYVTHDGAVQYWDGLDEAGREREIETQPNATILYAYNFPLGITERLPEPRIIPRAEYENEVRPDLRDTARRYAERFDALCWRLAELDRPGGPADRLSFTVLVDALIRRSPPPVADAVFRDQFRVWIDEASPLVWAFVEEWADRHGYPPGMLAADNVLYRASLTPDGTAVLVEPHVAVDLHDHEILVDVDAGLAYAFPGGGTPRLRDCVVARPGVGIADPRALHARFCSYVRDRLGMETLRARSMDDIRERIMEDRLASAVVHSEAGRRQLLRGDFAAAIESLNVARGADLAPVYFWAALARQASFLRLSWSYRLGGADAGWQRPLNDAFGALLQALRPARDPAPPEPAARAPGTSLLHAELFAWLAGAAAQEEAPLEPEARRLLDQLRAKDPTFVAGLLEGQSNLAALTAASLDLTPAERNRVAAAMGALSALDDLGLAEEMKDLAHALPVTGRWTDQLGRDLRRIVERARALPFADPPGMQQMEELARLPEHP
jgi:hypothetical protein